MTTFNSNRPERNLDRQQQSWLRQARKAGYFIALIGYGTAAQAQIAGQICTDAQTGTTKVSLQPAANGTVIDISNSLQWSACNLGEVWQRGQCSGDPKHLSVGSANSESRNSQLAGFGDWRLPTLDELQTLSSNRCYLPAADLTLFPTTLSTHYWSADRFQLFAWSVGFDFGEPVAMPLNYKRPVRLVRTLPTP